MRLTKAEFSGFGRLAKAQINLDHKVVAIVGPNEAGKTTLLNALAYIDNGESLGSSSDRVAYLAISPTATLSCGSSSDSIKMIKPLLRIST
jgi:predicted ATP-dependent endonuclease of OLD family